mmetsp:Transcript_37475/g.79054  ORF Transcript_37475/g.79054 Transcript_37475/m.79054 type:complete len:321 (+) Transcript_37475:2-964(+)
MMLRPLTTAILYLILSAPHNSCNAKAFVAEASSSYLAKVASGLAQSAEWLSDFVVGTSSRRQPRKVKLAIVSLGRTGTTSFTAALKQLGYAPIHDDNCHEVSDIYAKMMDGSFTMDEVNIALGERGFDAPMISTREYVQWAARAPNVKVILTVRDTQKWAQSWLSVVPAAFLPLQRPFCWIRSIRELSAFNTKVMVDIPTNGHPELYDDVPTLEAGFDAWTKYVMKTIPRKKLLVFDVKQGWKPLCDFLGEPVPEGSFPHINDRVVVDIIVKVFVALTWIWPLLIPLPFLVVYLLAVYLGLFLGSLFPFLENWKDKEKRS